MKVITINGEGSFKVDRTYDINTWLCFNNFQQWHRLIGWWGRNRCLIANDNNLEGL